MKKNRIAITALNFLRACAVPMAMLVAVSLVAQTAPYDSAKPLPHATVFAPGIISTGDYESHATFTPDGREIYFLKMAPNFSRWTIFVPTRTRSPINPSRHDNPDSSLFDSVGN